jgi:hypothetical protein
MDGQLADSADQMQQQRSAIHEEKAQKRRRRNQVSRIAHDTGLVLPEDGVSNISAEEIKNLRDVMKGETE